MTGQVEEYMGALAMLKAIPAELKLVIAGNHDLSLHRELYLNTPRPSLRPKKVEASEKLWLGSEAKTAGVTYLTEGLHEFELSNGARFTIYASPWQPLFMNWAFNYPHNEDRWNPPALVDLETGHKGEPAILAPREHDPHYIPEGGEVDIVMTHGPPWKHRDRCQNGYEAGCPHLLRALNRVRPRLHCFGHIHEAWGAERVTWGEERHRMVGTLDEKDNRILGEAAEWIISENSPSMNPKDDKVIEQRAVYLDVSNSSDQPLKAGKETIFVNSSIMTFSYQPEGAGRLVDLELPLNQGKAIGTGTALMVPRPKEDNSLKVQSNGMLRPT